MAKRELLRLPGTFEEALSDLMRTPPPQKEGKPKAAKKRKPKKAR